VHVEDDHVRGVLDTLEGFVSARGLDDLVPVEGQDGRDQLAGIGDVIDDQDRAAGLRQAALSGLVGPAPRGRATPLS
jgi:hypothetical protein